MAGSTQQVPRTTLNSQGTSIRPTTGGPNVPIRKSIWHGRRDDQYAMGSQTVPLHYSSTSSTVAILMYTAQQPATRQRESQSRRGHITRRGPVSKFIMS